MYANKSNVLELVSLMLKFEINQIVVCPGSRNAPLSQSFAADKRFECYSITDERSAGFFALGLAQALQRPIAVCCTSGSALLNILPAVSEAYYQQLPLLVVSADRPLEWIGQMDGQTIPQPNMASSIFKKSVHLPEVKDETEYWFCNRLINEALLALTHHANAPVHINIPLSEPLFDFSVAELPEVRKIDRYFTDQPKFKLSQTLSDQWNNAMRPLIIVGQQPYSKELNRLLSLLESEKKCVILSEHIGNAECGIHNFDSILHTADENENLKPDLVIYFGGHIVSKRLKAFIRNNPPRSLWHITPDGEVIDTFKSLTALIESKPILVLDALYNNIQKRFSDEYQSYWISLSKAVEKHSESYSFSEFSDIYVLKKVIELLPKSYLQLANSSIIRNSQLFPLKNIKSVFCNRGTSGIEGSLSTAVGFSVGCKELTYLIIGDLSFFYDMNGLWNQYVSNKLRILVINNGNGQIFNTLPNLEKSEIRSRFIAAEHNTSVEAWVRDRGCAYLSANNQNELDRSLSVFCNPEINNQPLVLEVFTDAEISESDIKEYYKQLKYK